MWPCLLVLLNILLSIRASPGEFSHETRVKDFGDETRWKMLDILINLTKELDMFRFLKYLQKFTNSNNYCLQNPADGSENRMLSSINKQ